VPVNHEETLEGPPDGPLADLLQEAQRVAGAAGQQAVELRILGGVAIALCSPSALRPPLARPYADIDVIGRAREARAISDLLVGAGYTADKTFNALHGSRRLFFWDTANQRQLDVFLNKVEMCHVLDLSDRLLPGTSLLAPADLLLLKLQVFETNEKDYLDVVSLLLDHEFTDDDSGINTGYLEGLLGEDWGLWQTTIMVAERAKRFVEELDGFDQAPRAIAQLDRYLACAESAPKSRRWRMRARVGQRKRWYELPEESH
jgi:hypothetical protein